MTTWATVHNDVATEIATVNPTTIFHAEVAAQFVTVPDGTEVGATFANGTWANPTQANPSAPAAVVYPELPPMAFYLAFTPAERIAIKTSKDPVVAEFWATYQLSASLNQAINPNLMSVVEGLEYLATTTPPILASAARIAQIQAGVAQ